MKFLTENLQWSSLVFLIVSYIVVAIINFVEVFRATRNKTRRWQAVLGLWFLWGMLWYIGMGGWPLREPPHLLIGVALYIVVSSIKGWVLSRIKES